MIRFNSYILITKNTSYWMRVKGQNGLSIFVGKGKIHYQFSESSLGSQTSNVERSISEVFEGAPTAGKTYNMYRLDVELVGANENPRVRNEQKIDYVESYYSSHIKEGGATANAYSRIVYENVYPNIDWILSANKGKLKHEFIVHKGGNVADIKLRYGGASKLDKSQNGGVVANTPLGKITETAPYCYQSDKKVVSSEFVVKGDIVSYNIGKYIGELTIDPNLDWATYFGGSGNENGISSAIDASGNFYVGGTISTVSEIVKPVASIMAAVPVPEAVTLTDITSPRTYVTPVVPATVFQLVVPINVIL
jgi:hypothetical protein